MKSWTDTIQERTYGKQRGQCGLLLKENIYIIEHRKSKANDKIKAHKCKCGTLINAPTRMCDFTHFNIGGNLCQIMAILGAQVGDFRPRMLTDLSESEVTRCWISWKHSSSS